VLSFFKDFQLRRTTIPIGQEELKIYPTLQIGKKNVMNLM
jgi:hypothetical protein